MSRKPNRAKRRALANHQRLVDKNNILRADMRRVQQEAAAIVRRKDEETQRESEQVKRIIRLIHEVAPNCLIEADQELSRVPYFRTMYRPFRTSRPLVDCVVMADPSSRSEIMELTLYRFEMALKYDAKLHDTLDRFACYLVPSDGHGHRGYCSQFAISQHLLLSEYGMRVMIEKVVGELVAYAKAELLKKGKG